ncbi:hypothetical protein NL444_28310, partial [Klebsiella pneumoniae]|nr:hypothetical protein [Klebsiella pneumoniae]
DPPTGTDPGGAHAKGFSADRPDATPVPPTGPIPVADAPPGATITTPGYGQPLPAGEVPRPDGDERIATRL